MSALAGILNFNDEPLDERLLDALGRRLVKHGPDGGGCKQAGAIGMVFRTLCTDRESRREMQPVVSALGHLLAWDGRLDNRRELVSQLRDDIDASPTDVDLVMASYLRWGIDCFRYLIGDFALCLWDPSTRTLLLVRDAFGTRPIYYQVSSQSLVWSSDLASLVDLSSLPIEVDREYVASYLASAPDLNRTAYQNFHSVPPGVALIVCNSRIEKREFWRPDPQHRIRYRHDFDYEEHFRELFREAVRCRLRADRPVWAELSGGLDSSSIVCMADQIIEPAGLETVSYVYDNSPASDERRFIGEVEAWRGRTGHHFHEDEYVGRFRGLNLDTIVRPNPTYRFTARHDWVRARMQQTGSSVLLSGIAGDNLLWSGSEISPQLADLLVQLKLKSLHKQLRAWSNTTRDSYVATLWRGAMLPLLPRSLRMRFSSDPSTLVDRNFAKQMPVAPDPFFFKLPSERAQVSMLSSAIRSVASCYYRDRVATEYRFPFLHRPLVEFLLAIPIDQKVRPGENRSLQRRALKDVLPRAIFQRQSKRWPTEALCRMLANNWYEVEWLFKQPRVCDYGFVDAQALAEAAKRVRHGRQNVSSDLSAILSVELWLRAFESRRSSSLNEVRLAS